MEDSYISSESQVARNSIMMTGLVFLSRITGFIRTWAQAFTLGATMLASCYTVANNLPNLLFEITCGGMLYTAFLPVYISVKKNLGKAGASDYVSNMTGIILVMMGVLTIAAFIFASPLVFTQSAGADSTFSFDTATLFFRFFCIEVLLYPLSSLLGGVLNAERKYFWSQMAPVFNNVVVIVSFIIGFKIAQTNEFAGFLIYAIGNPLGVLVQVLVQIRPMKKQGIKLSLKIDLKDPALKETLKIGLPSLLNTLCAAVLASIQSSWSLYSDDAGAAILYYVRVWFVLPASLFAVPIQTAMVTELSTLFSNGDKNEFKRRMMSGLRQITFMMVPFALYLMVFSPFLMAFFAAGNFDNASFTNSYVCLSIVSISLPFYALVAYLINVCAASHDMKFLSLSYLAFTIIACIFCVWAAKNFMIPGVMLSFFVFNFGVCVAVLIRFHHVFGSLGFMRAIKSSFVMLVLGGIGAILGCCVAYPLATIMTSGTEFYSAFQAFVAVLVGGVISLAITYGLAMLFKVEEAQLIKKLISKLRRKKTT